ncbi:MAG: ACT domain-containing protein [Candidatus Nanopelagicales bacterium]
MATLVLTVLGDDRSGLVSALSGVIAAHGGSWERSQMARLAGKFAGIVLVRVPNRQADALIDELGPLSTEGLLDVTVERTDMPAQDASAIRLLLELVGGDRPGIVHDISRALSDLDVSIEELSTQTREAPMAGGMLFEATATLLAPRTVQVPELRGVLEEIANELMVHLELSTD